MFKVTLHNLTADARAAFPGLDPIDLGELEPEALLNLLEKLAALDPAQVAEAEPQLTVTGRAGKYAVRTGQGKLLLYNARDSSQPYVELTAPEIVGLIDRALTPAPFGSGSDSAPGASRPAPHAGTALAMLVVGLALNGYTLYAVLYTDSVNRKPDIKLVTDAAELAAHRTSFVGSYFTGRQSGDRGIVITADGTVRFTVLGTAPGSLESNDTSRVGRHDNRLCLDTPESGMIDIVNLDTLVYYRDTYRREK